MLVWESILKVLLENPGIAGSQDHATHHQYPTFSIHGRRCTISKTDSSIARLCDVQKAYHEVYIQLFSLYH